MERLVDPLTTIDAKLWADEFMKVKARLGEQKFDHAMMLGWFANAIMQGYDEGQRRAKADAQAQIEALQREHTQLQALVRALPVFTDISVRYTKDENDFEAWNVRVDHGPFAECETEAAAQGLMAILKYRATLDALTPAREEMGCQICKGAKGVPGNEQIINGIVVCDYCHVAYMREEGGDGE